MDRRSVAVETDGRTDGAEEREDGAAKLAESQNLCHGGGSADTVGDEKSLQSLWLI